MKTDVFFFGIMCIGEPLKITPGMCIKTVNTAGDEFDVDVIKFTCG